MRDLQGLNIVNDILITIITKIWVQGYKATDWRGEGWPLSTATTLCGSAEGKLSLYQGFNWWPFQQFIWVDLLVVFLSLIAFFLFFVFCFYY